MTICCKKSDLLIFFSKKFSRVSWITNCNIWIFGDQLKFIFPCDGRGGSRLQHLYHINHCFKDRNCSLYSSLKKKIFQFPIPTAEEIFLFPPVNLWSDLQNPGNNSISCQWKFQEKNMNTGDKKETPLADLGIALRKMFPCLPLHVIGNVFYPKTSCFVPKTCAAFFFRNLLCIILYH